MAHRHSDTEIWRQKWFRKLSKDAKLFWYYVKDNCDNAGVWHIDEELLDFQAGVADLKKVMSELKGRMGFLTDDKIIIKGFIEYHWGVITRTHKMKNNIISLLNTHHIPNKYTIDTLSIDYPSCIDTGNIKLNKVKQNKIEQNIEPDEPKVPEPAPKKAIVYPSLPELLTYFTDYARKEFTNINTEAVETEAKLYHSIRTGDKWVKANKKKVKNWKLDVQQWVLSKRSKLIDYDQKKSTRLLPSNDTAAFIEGVKTW